VARSGGDPDHTDDRRLVPAAASAFIGCGAQYARPVGSRMVSSIPSSTKLSSRRPTPRKFLPLRNRTRIVSDVVGKAIGELNARLRMVSRFQTPRKVAYVK
jgi:hypothetical protein